MHNSWTKSICITWKLVKNADSLSHIRSNQKFCVCTSLPRDSGTHLRLRNYWSELGSLSKWPQLKTLFRLTETVRKLQPELPLYLLDSLMCFSETFRIPPPPTPASSLREASFCLGMKTVEVWPLQKNILYLFQVIGSYFWWSEMALQGETVGNCLFLMWII